MVRQAGPPARAAWWWALRARGIDMTSESADRSTLVLAAHPDDETLGCAATIMRKRDAGTPVVLVIATDGSASSSSKTVDPAALARIRMAETTEAGRSMGLDAKHIVRLGYEDANLERDEKPLGRVLLGLFERHRPDEVLVTSAHDPHPDHAALGRAARRAIGEPAGMGIQLLEYPIWQWRRPASWLGRSGADSSLSKWCTLARMRPELISTDGYLDRKRLALAAYQSQVTNLTGEPDWWSLDRRFLVNFFRSHELFLPAPPG